MRFEKRHSLTNKNTLYEFQFFDKDMFKTGSLLKIPELKCLEEDFDFIIVYAGIQREEKAENDGPTVSNRGGVQIDKKQSIYHLLVPFGQGIIEITVCVKRAFKVDMCLFRQKGFYRKKKIVSKN
ncbi:hypothetical protein [Solobacterium moorei]|uniref:hypothetical protein n=1 Tax=Solobacterium moorei TaxID=102148 RepID=UPI0015F2F76A|nr:hypothetical protein [Solobacterium moorei]